MGEVYRARDTLLSRHVALKVLPEAFSRDIERMARFEREAKLLASLNHPNIAAIYGLEVSGQTRALVMELVEGPTLADRIRMGAIPLEEALPIARQIADAVEYAHDKNVIHRDLKPANIKVKQDGIVKVLDFGLAKAMSEDLNEGAIANSPTLSMAATRQGIILGTAAYMSPEQARGKQLDRRTDIWSFGVVLYEMLTGRQAFEAEDVSLTLAAVMKSDPDWNLLPKDASSALLGALRRCLQKDPKQRLRDMGDVRLAMEGAFETAAAPKADSAVVPRSPGWQRAAIVGVASLILGSVAAGFSVWTFTRPKPQPPVRLSIVHEGGTIGSPNDPDVAISPDGRRVVYEVSPIGGNYGRLYVRSLDQLEPTLLTDLARSPFFSPDGQWLAFANDKNTLSKVAVSGGPVVSICKLDGVPRGATWGPGDTIIFATSDTSSGLFRVPAAGGEPQVLTKPDVQKGELDHLYPELLPGGHSVLFTITKRESVANSEIAVLDLDKGTYRVLIQGGSNPHYSSSGHIIYGVAGTLRAVAFDLPSLQVHGTPSPVVEGVTTKTSGAASFSVSPGGTLAYLAGGPVSGLRNLVWVDRQGREEAIKAPPRAYAYARVSPDGTRVALDIRDQENDIWIWDLRRENLARLTFDPGMNRGAEWTPDGKRLAFSAQREGSENIYWQPADGSSMPEALTKNPKASLVPEAISPDGTQLLFTQSAPPRDIGRVQLDGEHKSDVVLKIDAANAHNPAISPDGRWLAYQSDESVREEIYVRPFPDVNGGRWQITTNGGTRPLWNPNGRELFYYTAPGTLMSVSIEPGATFRADTPRMVFQGRYPAPQDGRQYSISPDGRRFLMIKDAAADADAPPAQIVIVQNWFEELKQKVPVGAK
jgi:serine/threonine-protein kinase